jgi:hypothetical protein
MPAGDGLGDGAGRFNERSLLVFWLHRMPLKRGTGWSGLIAELHFFEGSEAEDLNRGAPRTRMGAAVLGPGRKFAGARIAIDVPKSRTNHDDE